MNYVCLDVDPSYSLLISKKFSGTPLTLIMGPLQDALDKVREPKVQDMLNMASRNVARLSRLVDSLMDFTRIEAGRLLGRFKLFY